MSSTRWSEFWICVSSVASACFESDGPGMFFLNSTFSSYKLQFFASNATILTLFLFSFDRSFCTWEPEENLEHLEVFQKYIEKMEKEKAASESRNSGEKNDDDEESGNEPEHVEEPKNEV